MSSAPSRPCGANSGFTLLEILIAITAIGMIAAIVGASMSTARRSVDAGERRIARTERLRAALDAVDSQLQSVLMLKGTNDDGLPVYIFGGGKDTLTFASSWSLWGVDDGRVVVRYDVVDEGRSKAIRVSEESLVVGRIGEAVLIDGLDDAWFEYFHRPPAEEKGGWTDSWEDTEYMPLLAGVHIVFDGNEIFMPVALRAVKGDKRATSFRGLLGR